MKKEFIEGRWYKQKNGFIGKFLLKNRSYSYPHEWPCREYISNNELYCSSGNYFSTIPSDIIEVPISEIAHLLPKDHPDLQNIERIYELW